MTEKDFQRSLAIMLFAMVSIVAGAWVAHSVTPLKPSTNPPQLTV